MKKEKPVNFYRSKDIMGLEEPPSVGNSTNKKRLIDYSEEELPDLLTRVKAIFIDAISILLIFILTSWVINNVGDLPTWIRAFIFIFMIYLYEPTLVSSMGGTIGHKFMNIKVVNYSTPSKRINFIQACLRFVTKYFLGWISLITISFNKNKRAIHDSIGNSIVLYEKASKTR